MKIILFILIVSYVVWAFLVRREIIGIKYRKDKGSEIEITSNDDLFKEIKEFQKELFPVGFVKDITSNESIEITCESGMIHEVSIENGKLFVSRAKTIGTPSFKNMKNLEEAEIIRCCILGRLDAKYKKMAETKYKSMTRHLLFRKISLPILIIIMTILGTMAVKSGNFDDMVRSKGISLGTLDGRSSLVNIGEAFEKFFSDVSWTSYDQGAQEYIDFKGTCMFGDTTTQVIITFVTLPENRFKITKVLANGEEILEVEKDLLLNAIYEPYETYEKQPDTNMTENDTISEGSEKVGGQESVSTTADVSSNSQVADTEKNEFSESMQYYDVIDEYVMSSNGYQFKFIMYQYTGGVTANDLFANIYYESVSDVGYVLNENVPVNIVEAVEGDNYYELVVADDYSITIFFNSEDDGITLSENQSNRPAMVAQNIDFTGVYNKVP